MQNQSIWINNKFKNKNMHKLDKDILCDVLVIGGGIAGLSVAYHMMNSNMRVVLIEKDKCGMGATSKNTGKLTWMQDLIYARLTNNYNSDVAKLYFDSQKDAIKIIKNIIDKNKIDCHLSRTNSYVFSYMGNDYIDFSDEVDFYKK
jgi:succinate dehydrogenase/fumarate reductase flavoprotein subunit